MKIGVLFAALLFVCGCVLAQPQPGKKPATRALSSLDELDAAGIGVGYQRPDLAAGERFIEDLKPAEPPPKRELGPIDRWRYDSCRTEASKAPTKEGVRAGLQVCHEKFGQ